MSQDFKKQTNKGKAMCDGVGQSLQIKEQQGSTWSVSGSSPLRPSLGVFAFEVQDAMGLPKHIVWMRKGVNTQMGQKFELTLKWGDRSQQINPEEPADVPE